LFSSSSFIIQVTVAEETHSLRKDIRLVGDPVRGKMIKKIRKRNKKGCSANG
jgi:hypothetical protein